MNEDIQKNMAEFNKNAIEATKQLIELNGRIMGKVLESQVDLANLYVEGGEKQLEISKDIKDPNEFIAKQTSVIEEYASKLAEATERNIKLAQEAGEEMKSWVQKNLKPVELGK